MIGAGALSGGSAKVILGAGGNLLLNQLYGDDLQRGKEILAAKGASLITPSSADALKASNEQGKIAYQHGWSDTNGDEIVQGAVFILELVALGGGGMLARKALRRNNSANKTPQPHNRATVEKNAANKSQNGAERAEKPGRSSDIQKQKAHHDKIVDQEKNRLESEGYEVSDKGISFRCAHDNDRCIPDITYRTPDGKLGGFEIKTGNGKLSKNQEKIYPQIESGEAIPVGKNAKEFELDVGKPLKEGFPIETKRYPGLGE